MHLKLVRKQDVGQLGGLVTDVPLGKESLGGTFQGGAGTKEKLAVTCLRNPALETAKSICTAIS